LRAFRVHLHLIHRRALTPASDDGCVPRTK
jgi:hypothetical protein